MFFSAKNKNVKTEYLVDMKDKDQLKQTVHKFNPNIIFHLAADKNRDRDIETFYSAIDNNLITTLNLFNASMDLKNLESIVLVNTAEEYGIQFCPFNENYNIFPISPYSFSKACISQLAILFYDLYKLPVVILRPTLVYGYGQGNEMFLPALIETLLSNNPFDMTKGEQKRDFLYIDDFVDVLVKAALTKSAVGNIFNIGSSDPMQIKDIALFVAEKLNKKDFVKIGALPYRENEIMNYFVDIEKAKTVLNWNPKVKIQDGIELILKKYLEKLNK